MNSRMKRVGLVALALSLSTATFAMAEETPYGYEAASSAECTTDYPVFESFEDGSAGCFRTDTPALREWEPGEYERTMLSDPEYDVEETLVTLGITREEAVSRGWLPGEHDELADRHMLESLWLIETNEEAWDALPTPTKPSLPKAGV